MSSFATKPASDVYARPVLISEETRNDLEAFADVIGREGYRVNASMLRKIVALWDSTLVAVESEDAA